jgi:UDPglucose 6-dehydrogenase
MKVSIIGAGYVGLVTGACLAEKGHRVVCVEQDRQRVEQINRAEPPIYEKGLPELMQKRVGANLIATRNLKLAITDSEVTLIAVGTPFNGRRIDLLQVESASRQIGNALKQIHCYHLVVVKSTVVPGTTDDVVIPLLEAASVKKAGLDFGVGGN